MSELAHSIYSFSSALHAGSAQSTRTSLYHRCFSVLSPRISATKCAPACGGLLYIARAISCSQPQ
jgi:hypothetical protein